ncbi:MAG TPA: hypothetical protein VFM06_10405 [Candidatus Limnocylindria bacterium]|nr:hypothetical protein [Candidatus Limnocylindria bacterium]
MDVTLAFLESLIAFPRSDQRRFVKAARLLNENEKHPSLRVHELSADMAGLWSASASDELRIIFVRTAAGGKTLLRCTRHYR